MRIFQGLFLLLLLAGSVVPAHAAEPPVRVLLLPITMYTPDEQPFLRNGLIEMLSSRLRRNPGIQVLLFGDSKVEVANVNAARELAKNRGVDFVLFGSFTQFGDGVSLDLQCLATSASASARAGDASRGVFVKSSSFKDFIRDLDDLALRVSAFVLPPGAPLAPTSLGAGAGTAEFRELERRVEKLEKELRALEKDAQNRAVSPPTAATQEAR